MFCCHQLILLLLCFSNLMAYFRESYLGFKAGFPEPKLTTTQFYKDVGIYIDIELMHTHSEGAKTYLIRLKMLSRSFFISTRVRVWSRKRSFICCSLTFDSPLKFISISLVFSNRSSLLPQSKDRK